MEVVQGKSTDKKIVIAQEIAFAKVLSGNNKTLRDRALKKLRKWLTIRGNGRWGFTEDEFLRIWTGLFYCMWMSDKFLVQEELAENISHLIHCFKKNIENALLFIKCFNKRILMDWQGLDQYRIDKFNMLVRRFLRQTFVYCKEKNWSDSILHELTDIFYNEILSRDNSLGFILHFINIYAEELAKVSKGKLDLKIVLILVEPFVKILSRSKESRITSEVREFFKYLVRQTDVGIEFDEKFNAWKQQGFPGSGPECLQKIEVNGKDFIGSDNDDDTDEDIIEDDEDKPLDPRAGSVHVFLPQIPIDVDGFIQLFKKYQNSKLSTTKGKKMLKTLINKYRCLKKGKYPANIKKDPILDEKTKKRNQTLKNAKRLIEYTSKINEGPIKTRELKALQLQLDEQSDEESEIPNCIGSSKNNINGEIQNDCSSDEDNVVKINKVEKKIKTKQLKIKNSKKSNVKNTIKVKKEDAFETKEPKDDTVSSKSKINKKTAIKKKDKLKKNLKKEENIENETIKQQEQISDSPKTKKKLNGIVDDKTNSPSSLETEEKVTPKRKSGVKRKILSNWQVQELDTSSPDYYKIETPKVIRIEIKNDSEQNVEETTEVKQNCQNLSQNEEITEKNNEETTTEEFIPVFWNKAKSKVFKNKSKKLNVLKNPFANINEEPKVGGFRRISFALDKNMAQENAEYLEEVKNSPKLPFDGSRKPVQSALKSGLSPSPVNPFYRYKKIKVF